MRRPIVIWTRIAMLLAAGAVFAGDWPQWHGPTRDGRISEGSPVPTSLPRELKPAWKIPVGGGHSSPVVAEGKLVYLDEDGREEVANCVEAGSGKALWRVPFAARNEDEWGAGPRSTPSIDGDRVYVQSCNGEFRCLSLKSGAVIWATSFEKDFGVRWLGYKSNEGVAARRGNNGSGVVDGPHVIVPVGSTNGAMLVCFDKLTGEVAWKTGEDEAAYSSPVVADIAGRRQVIYFSAGALLGVDRANGRILWRVPLRTAAQRHAATPIVRDDRVMTTSHTFGTLCLKITGQDGSFKAAEAWLNREMKINLATPVLADGHLYSQGPARDYVCFDATTGALKWTQPGFGVGRRDYSSTLVLGRNLLVLTEDGTLLLLASNPEKYTELGRLQVCGNTWSFPAYADGKLYVRDGRHLACIDLIPSPH